MAEYLINVQGYYKQDMMNGVPSVPGIFIVYRGIHDTNRNRAILKELIYIGETSNLNISMNNHDNINYYSQSLQNGETLFFCFAQYQGTNQDRKIIANMMIAVTLPSLNNANNSTQLVENSIIKIEGDRHAFLPSRISMS